jgi:hypothetical protein
MTSARLNDGIGTAYSKGVIDESVAHAARTISGAAAASIAKSFRTDAAVLSASARAAGLMGVLDTAAFGRHVIGYDERAAASIAAMKLGIDHTARAQLAALAEVLKVQIGGVSRGFAEEIGAAARAAAVSAVQPLDSPGLTARFASAIATGVELAESPVVQEAAIESLPEVESLSPAERRALETNIPLAIALYALIVAALLDSAQLELAARILEFLAVYIAIFRDL